MPTRQPLPDSSADDMLNTSVCPQCNGLLNPGTEVCQQCGQVVGSAHHDRTGVRWFILSLVFFGITVNYLDRQVLSMLARELDQKYGIDDAAFGEITSCFSIAYAISQLAAGGWLDAIGARMGYAIALFAWSASSMAHALVTSVSGFKIVRILLGISESPAYPGASKVLAEWFPKRERAFAMGWVNGGSNIGLLLAAACVPPITAHYGIRAAFLFTGGAGLLFSFCWVIFYRSPDAHPTVNAAELAYIRSDAPEPKVKIPWLTLMKYPQAWAFIGPKFLTDAMWGFLTMFGAKFLAVKFDLDIKHIGRPMVVVYLLADFGSIGGGWVSSTMMKRGATVNSARKIAMLICALAIVPIGFVTYSHSLYVAALLVGLALAGHQGFSANQYTLISDMFPRRVVASVAGMGGCIGYIGAALLQNLGGKYLQRTGSDYRLLMAIVAGAYLLALFFIHILAPTLTMAKFRDDEAVV